MPTWLEIMDKLRDEESNSEVDSYICTLCVHCPKGTGGRLRGYPRNGYAVMMIDQSASDIMASRILVASWRTCVVGSMSAVPEVTQVLR